MNSIKVVIENFRNIGYNPEPDKDKKRTQFLLSRTTNPEYSGDLCILLGKNNSGKSNVLSAIQLLKNPNDYKVKDIPDNLKVGFTKKGLKPNVYVIGSNSNNKLFDIKEPLQFIKNSLYELEKKNKACLQQLNNTNTRQMYNYGNNYNNRFVTNDLFNMNITNIYNSISREGYSYTNYEKDIESLDIFNTIKNTKEDECDLQKALNLFNKLLQALNFLMSNSWQISNILFCNNITKILKEWVSSTDIKNKLNQYINEINNINEKIQSFPFDIYWSDNITYKQSDFSIDINKYNIENSFFKTLFSLAEIDIDNLISTINSQNSYPQLKRINKEIEKVSKEFNNVFSLFDKEVEYSFSISWGSKLNFGISLKLKNEDEDLIPQNYDQQSSGFKWFFDFFFTFWSKFNKNNDKQKIVLLDEPGNGLSMFSLRQLRIFLKKIANKYGIIFALTTHRPEWIDLDYLEELRIIKKSENELIIQTEIYNDFIFETDKKESWIIDLIRSVEANFSSFSSSEDSDDYDDTKNYILVEGITDYLYLTAIKIYLLNNHKKEDKQFIKKLKSLYFIPINGVEFDKEDIKDKFKVYQKIFKTKSFLFIVDNDNAGMKFKRIIDNDTLVKTIGEIMNDKKDIKTIEDFIDDEDIKNFKLVDSNDKKHIINSYEFKRALIDNKVSKTSINNLSSFIKKIIEEIS